MRLGPCVLRAVGSEFTPAAFLAESGLRAQPFATPRASGFNATVSEAGPGDLDGQVRDALRFLAEHEDELQRLGRFAGVEEVCLEFTVPSAGAEGHSALFPAELLWRAGALDIDLVVTAAERAPSAAAPGEPTQ